jgi:flagellar protein FliO/FliZ
VDLWDSLLRMVSALAIVLGLMGATAFLAKRFSLGRVWMKTGTPLVQVISSGHLNSRASISLVAVAGEVLIVGTTATALVPLGRITDLDRVRQMLGQAGLSSHSASGAEAEQKRKDDTA